MSFPRLLASDADASDLTAWLTEWSLFYPFDYDDQLSPIVRPATGAFDVDSICLIVGWKAERRWRKSKQESIRRYDGLHPGTVAAKTRNALSAVDDASGLSGLRGIPQVQAPAFGSAVLTVGDPDRWTVFDKMASASLVQLRDHLSIQQTGGPLQSLAGALARFRPPRNRANEYLARVADWPTYMLCCRAISATTWLSLRTVDRALYEARGR
jgi:hypothetical protein